MVWHVVVLVLLYITWKLFKSEANALDKLPGPPRLPVFGNVFTFIRIPHRELFLRLVEFSKLYGDRYVIKIFNRHILHVHKIEDVEVILSHSHNIQKSKPYDFLEPWLGTGLLISTGSKWHRRRKILTPTFHFNILKHFTKVFEDRTRDLVNKLKRMPDGEVNVSSVISDYTLYTICETAMGIHLDPDRSTSSIQYKDSIKKIGMQVISRLSKVWLHTDIIFYNTALGKQFKECLNTVHTFADNVINERRQRRRYQDNSSVNKLNNGEGSKNRLALLDLLLEVESNGEIDVEGIREEVNTFMFEGHDTTAMALTFGLVLLADHEQVQDNIYDECKRIFGESDRTPSWSDLAEMKYLEAAIKEILRLYPSVPFIGRRITEDFMLDDVLVKKGTEVLVHIYYLHRREDIYPDPETFKPERFLNGEVRHPFAFVPFSAGPRNCIGQRFAMLEMKCALAEICRSFKLAPRVPGARPALIADIVLRPADSIYVNFTKR